MEGTLHGMPRGADVFREQVRIVGLDLRREALAALALIVLATVVIGINIARGTAESWFDSDEWAEIALISFLLPFAVWRRDRRFGPAFLWTLPVDRRLLVLARVFAGWVWLMGAIVIFVVWVHVLAGFSGIPGAETISLFVFSGATAAYLFGSALVLGLRHPLRWLLAALGVLFLLGYFNRVVDAYLDAPEVESPIRAAASSWESLPDPAQWAIATVLWIGAGLLAVWLAASRHRESRRH